VIEQIQNNPVPIVALAIVTVLFNIPLAVVGSLYRNFIFPLSMRDDVPLTQAWGIFWPAARHNVGGLFAFFFARVLIAIIGAVVQTLGVCCTCLVGALPIINQTLLAPFYVFERAHALYTLESLGPEFRIFGAPAFGGPDDSGHPPGPGYPYGPGAGWVPMPQGPIDPNPYAPPAAGQGNGPPGGYGGGYGGGFGPPGG
jgi:hypothetical protein